MTDVQEGIKAGCARGGDELDGAEALLLLLGEKRLCKIRIPFLDHIFNGLKGI